MHRLIILGTFCAAALLFAGCELEPNPWCSNPKSTGQAPYDMKWCQEDPDNGFPLNPGYYGGPFQDPAADPIGSKQLVSAGQVSPGATTLTRSNLAWLLGIYGFVTYNKTAMFTGTIYWASHSWADDDYNMDLLTPLLAGVSKQTESKLGNIPLLHLEYDSDETIDHYDGNSWWRSFHQAVDNNTQLAHAMVDGCKAIVIGKWVMDGVHGCRAEVHPVLGLAIQTKPTPAGAGSEEWHFFLRGRGNQGWWGSDNVTGIYNPTIFRFRGRPGIHSAHCYDVWVHKDRVDYDLKFDGNDVLLICKLPYTSDWIVGTLSMTYSGPAPTKQEDTLVARVNTALREAELTPQASQDLLGALREVTPQITAVADAQARLNETLLRYSGPLDRIKKDAIRLDTNSREWAVLERSYSTSLPDLDRASGSVISSTESLMEFLNSRLSENQRQVLLRLLDDELRRASLRARLVEGRTDLLEDPDNPPYPRSEQPGIERLSEDDEIPPPPRLTRLIPGGRAPDKTVSWQATESLRRELPRGRLTLETASRLLEGVPEHVRYTVLSNVLSAAEEVLSRSAPPQPPVGVIRVENAAGPPGGVATVVISADANVKTVAGVGLNIRFDSRLRLSAQDVSAGDLLAEPLTAFNAEAGQAILGFVSTRDSSGPGVLARLGFHIPRDAVPGQTFSVELVSADVNDAAGNVLPVNVQSGVVSVVTARRRGDVNGDGLVNIADATLALRAAVGLISPTQEQAAAIDVNNDGRAAISDVTLILRAAVGLFPLD